MSYTPPSAGRRVKILNLITCSSHERPTDRFLKRALAGQDDVRARTRHSASKGSINQSGHFQTAPTGMEVDVKDESRFPGKWAFFDFSGSAESAMAIPRSAACYSCHAQNAAVDNTFVQFYPTLLQIAKQKGTVKPISSE